MRGHVADAGNAGVSRLRILVLIEHFLPGEKYGGPVTTLLALIHHLRDRAEFMVVTRDRDYGEREPFPGVETKRWTQNGGSRCMYLPPEKLSPLAIARLLRDTPHEVLYLNTLYSAPFCHYPLLLRRVRAVPRRPVILAPRGQLDPGALSIKRRKKRVFLAAARLSGLFHDVVWHSTSAEETENIRRWFGTNTEIREAPNLRIPKPPPNGRPPLAGPLRIAFLSRLSPKKNLLGALEILSGVHAEVCFDVFGPAEDSRYFSRCQERMDRLPVHIRARYQGTLAHRDVHATLADYDLLLLPTLGENYGHVIAEAMAAGCAPLISDRTPWRDLANHGVGWDLPLDDLAGFRRIIENCANEDPARRRVRREAAVTWIGAVDADWEGIRKNASLFGLEQDQGQS